MSTHPGDNHRQEEKKLDPYGSEQFAKKARWVSGPRAFVHALVFGLIFVFGAVQIGIASYFLQKYGNTFQIQNYPSFKIRNLINLGLFNGIMALLLALGSFHGPILLLFICLFSVCVMNGVLGGMISAETPFSAMSCGSNNFAEPYTRFADDCGEYVTLEAVSWVLFALMLIASVSLFMSMLPKTKRFTVYGQ